MVLCWRNMTTEYSSPYKVELINVGTKFAQGRLVWFKIAYGKLNFYCTVILARRFEAWCKPCTTSISPRNNSMWDKVCGLFFFVRRLDFRFGLFLFSPVFHLTCDLIPDSASKKMWRLDIDDISIASRQISLRTVRGILVCFIRGVKVYGHMSHSLV